MKPEFETRGMVLTVRMPEEVDHPVSEWIRKESERIMRKIYIRTIEFDFRATTFMDSSGIGLLMGRYRALGMRKNCVRILHANTHIGKLLRISGVCKYLDLVEEKEISQQEELCYEKHE